MVLSADRFERERLDFASYVVKQKRCYRVTSYVQYASIASALFAVVWSIVR